MKLGLKLFVATALAFAAQIGMADPINFDDYIKGDCSDPDSCYLGQPQYPAQGTGGNWAITSNDGYTFNQLNLEGDIWLNLAISMTIDADSKMSIDVNNMHDGELLGIHFLNSFDNPTLSPNYAFVFAGTQNWGIRDYSTGAAPSGWHTFEIDLGAYAQLHGDWEGISFFYDYDAAPNCDAEWGHTCNEGRFKNVKVPEPGTLALLGLGLLGMGASRRKVLS